MEHPHVLAGLARVPDAQELSSLLFDRQSHEVFALDDDVIVAERLLGATVALRPHEEPGPDGGLMCGFYVRAEQEPNRDSRVLLGEERDRFGCRLPLLEWQTTERDWQSIVRTAGLVSGGLQWWHGVETYLWISEDRPWPWPAHGPMEHAMYESWGNHHLGTTRMADDPSAGVVDRNCRVHGTENLYIAGSSVFPTGSHANPTFTIVALAHRLAEHLSSSR